MVRQAGREVSFHLMQQEQYWFFLGRRDKVPLALRCWGTVILQGVVISGKHGAIGAAAEGPAALMDGGADAVLTVVPSLQLPTGTALSS